MTLLAASLLAGCTAVPPPPEREGVSVAAIVAAVECELASVYLPPAINSSLFDPLFARALLGLKVSTDLTSKTSLAFTPPMTSATVTVPLGSDFQDLSIRNATVEFDVQMRDLKPKKGSDPVLHESCMSNATGLAYAPSGLGLREWLASLAPSIGPADRNSLYSITYELEFTVVRAANGGFTFKTAHVNLDAAKGAAKRTTYNHLLVTFAPVTKPDGAPGKVPAGTSRQLDQQIDRATPLRLDLRDGTGTIIVE